MSLKDIVRNNTIEAWLRMKYMGLDLPWWEGYKVQRTIKANLRCPFTGGMIVRTK